MTPDSSVDQVISRQVPRPWSQSRRQRLWSIKLMHVFVFQYGRPLFKSQ